MMTRSDIPYRVGVIAPPPGAENDVDAEIRAIGFAAGHVVMSLRRIGGPPELVSASLGLPHRLLLTGGAYKLLAINQDEDDGRVVIQQADGLAVFDARTGQISAQRPAVGDGLSLRTALHSGRFYEASFAGTVSVSEAGDLSVLAVDVCRPCRDISSLVVKDGVLLVIGERRIDALLV